MALIEAPRAANGMNAFDVQIADAIRRQRAPIVIRRRRRFRSVVTWVISMFVEEALVRVASRAAGLG